MLLWGLPLLRWLVDLLVWGLALTVSIVGGLTPEFFLLEFDVSDVIDNNEDSLAQDQEMEQHLPDVIGLVKEVHIVDDADVDDVGHYADES